MFYIPVFLFLLSASLGLWLVTKFEKLSPLERALAKGCAWLVVSISLISAVAFIIFDLKGEEEGSTIEKENAKSEMLRIPEGKKGDYQEDLVGVETNEQGTPIGYKDKQGYKPGYAPEKQ